MNLPTGAPQNYDYLDDMIEYLEIYDLGCAATLVAKGFKLSKVGGNSLYTIFKFPKTEESIDIEKLYYNGDILVDPKKFFETIKHLKTLKASLYP